MAYLGVLVLLLSLVFGFASIRLIDPPSMIISIVGCFAATLYAFGTDVSCVWRALRSPSPTNSVALRAIAVLRSARSFVVATGVTGTLCGMVFMLANMDDPSAMTTGLAIASLTQLYGVMFGFGVVTPLIGAVRRKQMAEDGAIET